MNADELQTALAAFDEAIAISGSQSAFERETGARQQNVSNWIKRGKPLPAEFVLAAEKATGVSRHRLRPDIYPFTSATSSTVLPAEEVAQAAPIVRRDRGAVLRTERQA